jgi:subtilisin family serine protease
MADDSGSISQRRRVIQDTLAPRIVSEPLKTKIETELRDRSTDLNRQTAPTSYEVIIEINLNNPGGRVVARDTIKRILNSILGNSATSVLRRNRDDSTHPYVFATLTADQILELVKQDGDAALALDEERMARERLAPASGEAVARPLPRRTLRALFRIWESQKVHPLITESVRTVKANAAHNAFAALGENIVWAVMDSGIDASHPHFDLHQNLSLSAPLSGKSFSFTPFASPWDQDAFGHGTHVAGIIAGESQPNSTPLAAIQSADESGNGEYHLQTLGPIKGMAPKAKLLILRVLDDNGDGDETALIQAIEYIQQLNDFGRHLVVHGVNISAGFPAHPTWYACGQTPLCVEINRLMKSGVAVVVAAGNSGHIVTFLDPQNTTEAGQLLSINDPGNADLAITVGSTHRQSPHTFGISYFSSKGPTSDGRRKPEVVAPGEKIISSASSQRTQNATLPGLNGAHFDYIEDTGTSMAAPHVSGVLAAFLSIKREYIGQPEKVKALLMQSAMDLGRDTNIQGAGLVDLMKLIQSV